MTCTRCREPIARGQKYCHTKKGPHHAECPRKRLLFTLRELRQGTVEGSLALARALQTAGTGGAYRGSGAGEQMEGGTGCLNEYNASEQRAGECRRNYDSLDYLQRTSEEAYGMSYHEALEFAYDNVIAEAKSAVRGKRRPKDAMSQEGGNG